MSFRRQTHSRQIAVLSWILFFVLLLLSTAVALMR